MFGSTILDTILGLVFVFLLASLLCTAVNEALATFLGWRAQTMEAGLRNMLNDPDGTGIVKDFFEHPLIANLSKSGQKPSYIPSQFFVSALFNLLFPADSQGGGQSFEQVRAAVSQLKNPDLKSILTVYVNEAQGDVSKFRAGVEDWFNASMDRVSGWYKRRTGAITLALSLCLVVVLNVDAIAIGQRLYGDATLRSALAAAAQAYDAKNAAPGSVSSQAPGAAGALPATAASAELAQARQAAAGLPPAPKLFPSYLADLAGWQAWVLKILGLLATVLAASLGAPFWFDILDDFIRGSGAKPSAPGAD